MVNHLKRPHRCVCVYAYFTFLWTICSDNFPFLSLYSLWLFSWKVKISHTKHKQTCFFLLKVLIFQNIAIKIVNSFAHLLWQKTFFFVFKMTKLLDILIQMDILLPNSCMPTSSRKISIACQNPSRGTPFTRWFFFVVIWQIDFNSLYKDGKKLNLKNLARHIDSKRNSLLSFFSITKVQRVWNRYYISKSFN